MLKIYKEGSEFVGVINQNELGEIFGEIETLSVDDKKLMEYCNSGKHDIKGFTIPENATTVEIMVGCWKKTTQYIEVSYNEDKKGKPNFAMKDKGMLPHKCHIDEIIASK